MNFKEESEQKIKAIEAVLRRYLPQEEGYRRRVAEAMNYAILAGGKRLRPMIMAESAALFTETAGIYGEQKIPESERKSALLDRAMPLFMAALEMIHNYSLVHDDLPAMDNDEYRRGRKTTHVVYGEGMAVLAGDALLNYAFETASRAFDSAETIEEFRKVADSMKILSYRAGIDGMIGGQCADLEAEKPDTEVTEDMLMYIHEHKTAALIQAAMAIGGTLAGGSKEEVAALEKCAYKIGIAFQIQDDILDVTSSLEVLGKQVGSDEKNHKLTYVAVHGLEESKRQVERLSEEAVKTLASFPRRNLFLEELVRQLIYREK